MLRSSLSSLKKPINSGYRKQNYEIKNTDNNPGTNKKGRSKSSNFRATFFNSLKKIKLLTKKTKKNFTRIK
ncbi:hypothetical protein SF1_12210 [Sphingobacterium faecium NBRC 15299]|nr:hypothetical protein SF1_12210 [Sphingobacterium faecium NBRC 15299]